MDEINAALAVHSSELASLDAALAAGEQLERAREKEAQQTDRAAAAALLKELDHFRARFLSNSVRGVRIRAASLLAVVPTAHQPPADA